MWINMIFKRRNDSSRKSLSLTHKLIISYVLLTVIPMALLGLLAYSQYTSSIEKEVGKYTPRLLKQVNNNIENEIRKLEALPNLVYNSSDVMTILRESEETTQSKRLRDKYNVESYLTRTYLRNHTDNILGVFLISKNRVFSSTTLPYENFGFHDGSLPYLNSLSKVGSMEVVLSSQINLTFEGSPSYFMLIKEITDFDNRKKLGTIYIVVDVTFIEQFAKDLLHEKDAEVWMMTKDGMIIYHSDRSKIGTVDRRIDKYPILNGSFTIKKHGERLLVSLNESSVLPWVMAHSMPIKNLTETTDLVRNVTILIFIAFALITTAISIFFAMNVTRPLNNLSKMMKEVEKGDLSINIPVHSNDEVGQLAKSFNSMLMEIRELIKQKYNVELKQKTAELYALQSQINPHFMYNTLETISMSVEEEKTEDVVTMLTLLGRMLRYSLNNKDKLVTIRNELQHIEDYLRIQKFRFEERLHFEIEKEEKLLEYYIPKFVLQPIIENSIKYGLEKQRELKVKISVCEEHPDLILTVLDSGPGIAKEKLEELNERLMADPMLGRDSGIGIINVNARITMIFGDHYRLSITSHVNKGTMIKIRIPKINAYQANQLLLKGGGD